MKPLASVLPGLLLCLPLVGNLVEQNFDGVADRPLSSLGWQSSSNVLARLEPVSLGSLSNVLSVASTGGDSMVLLPVRSGPVPALWFDFKTAAQAVAAPIAPVIARDTAAAFYFDDRGGLVVFNGKSPGVWERYELPGLDQSRADGPKWRRVTVRNDYDAQQWAIWVDGQLIKDGLGFANPISIPRQMRISQNSEAPAYFDEVRISTERPEGIVGTVAAPSTRPATTVPVSQPVARPVTPEPRENPAPAGGDDWLNRDAEPSNSFIRRRDCFFLLWIPQRLPWFSLLKTSRRLPTT